MYIVQFGATKFELGVIISLLSFIAIAAKIPLGLLSEHVGRWPIIPAVAIGQTFSLLLYSIIPNLDWFYPIRIIHAIILAAFAPTAISITLDLAPSEKRGDKMGKFLTSLGVATMLGPFLCTFLVDYVDYVTLFRVASTIPIIGLIPFLLFPRQESESVFLRNETPSFLNFFKNVVHSRNILVLSYLRIVFSFSNAFFITLFAVYVEDTLLLLPSTIALLFGIKGVTNPIKHN